MIQGSEELLAKVKRLSAELESKKPAKESVEWYMINNLNTFEERIREAEIDDDLRVASRILTRFAVDSLDWGSPLMKSVEALSEEADEIWRRGR